MVSPWCGDGTLFGGAVGSEQSLALIRAFEGKWPGRKEMRWLEHEVIGCAALNEPLALPERWAQLSPGVCG